MFTNHKKNKETIIIATLVIVIAIGFFTILNLEFILASGVANLDLEAYRWRNDDGNEVNASWGVAENTATTSIDRGQVLRVRHLVHNTGTKDANGVSFGVTYGTNSDCTTDFTAIPVSGSCGVHPFCMYDTQLASGSDTTNVSLDGGITDPATASFVAGSQIDNSANSQTISIDNSPYEFSELEWGFQVTSNAAYGTTYYISLTGVHEYSTNRCAQIDIISPEITVGTTGTQTGTVYTGSNVNNAGGAFTFVTNTGSDTVTQIVLSETDGTFSAQTNLKDIVIRYETAATCTYNGDETIFGTANAFDGSENATVTGSMSVGTSQVCAYVEYNLGPGASDSQTIELEITDPSSEVTATDAVTPGTAVAIAGSTTVAEPSFTLTAADNQVANLNVDSTDNYIGGWFTIVADGGSGTITSITVSEAGDVSAQNNLANLDIRYEQTGSCSYGGGETLFGTDAAFDASEDAVVTGNLHVDTNQDCIYIILDVGAGASAGEVIDIEITDPPNEITVNTGTIDSGTEAIPSSTTLQASGEITVGTTGNQIGYAVNPTEDIYIGGAFTLIRDTGSTDVTEIIISETGTVNADSNLTNVDIYYETSASCNYDGGESLFGTAASFSSSDATISGTMTVGTSQICAYIVLDVESGASADETILIEITDPSSEVTATGSVTPGTAVAINNTTTIKNPQTLTFSISDNTIGFGTLDSGNSRYATGDLDGSGTEAVAHTLSASSSATNGYTITIEGPTLTNSYGDTITAIGGSATAPSAGSEQFGIKLSASGGSGTASSPYDTANYAYDGESAADQVASASSATATTDYDVFFLANIASNTDSGTYTSALTFVATANY